MTFTLNTINNRHNGHVCYAVDATKKSANTWAGYLKKPSQPASGKPSKGILIIMNGGKISRKRNFSTWKGLSQSELNVTGLHAASGRDDRSAKSRLSI
ncbi:MAG: hypothetical protein CVU48_08950 [Candidatus Cloacimonetes bacterium HGW-Cloacimonetes-1]|jgi:hypothetical protein|nr:MAG: hypothetical protein CVU48_08950 [Candidatus Cloacimonetes bacterium HGW-Cloacimonetes-1]